MKFGIIVLAIVFSAASTHAAIIETNNTFAGPTSIDGWYNAGTVNANIIYMNGAGPRYDYWDGDTDTVQDAMPAESNVMVIANAGTITGDKMLADGSMRFDVTDATRWNESIAFELGGTMEAGEEITFNYNVFAQAAYYVALYGQLWDKTDGRMLAQSAGSTWVVATADPAYTPLDGSVSYTATAAEAGHVLEIRLMDHATSALRDPYIDNISVTVVSPPAPPPMPGITPMTETFADSSATNGWYNFMIPPAATASADILYLDGADPCWDYADNADGVVQLARQTSESNTVTGAGGTITGDDVLADGALLINSVDATAGNEYIAFNLDGTMVEDEEITFSFNAFNHVDYYSQMQGQLWDVTAGRELAVSSWVAPLSVGDSSYTPMTGSVTYTVTAAEAGHTLAIVFREWHNSTARQGYIDNISVTSKRHLKVFVLTGQSNSLGTLGATDATMLRDAPGSHPVEQNMAVPFFWDNTTDGTPAGDALLGDSGGVWVDLGPQTGGAYANNDDHWGPEIGFSRMLWNAGYRDFGVVKASRGGGGNAYWMKGAADDHMYVQVTNAVNAAMATLPAGYDTYEIVGLLYIQGESNDATEAAVADTRFAGLLMNLETDLMNSTNLAGVFGEIGGGSTTYRDQTRTLQKALAVSRGDIGYASSVGTVQQADGLHYTADSQLLLGERMAAEMIGTGALGIEPMPAWTNLHAWYVADNATQPSPGGTINRWASLADGSALPDLFASLGDEPTLCSMTANDRERKVLDFDGNDDLWTGVSYFGSLAGDRSVAVLCRVKDTVNGFLFDGSTSAGRTRAQVRDGDWQAGVSASGWDVPEGITEPVCLGQWQRHVFTFSPNGTTTDIIHWINGVQVAAIIDARNYPLGGFMLGTCGDGSSHLNVEIAEVAVYEKVIDASEVVAIENAWLDRWGTPFGIGVVQEPKSIPRFGKHDLLQIAVDSPDTNSTLDEITITLKGDSPGRISRISVYDRSIHTPAWQTKPNERISIDNPSSNIITFPVNTPLLEGENQFVIVVEPAPSVALGGTVDAQVDQLVFSGTEAGTLVPVVTDPTGELVLALMPMSVDICTNGMYGLDARYRIPGIVCDADGVLHAVFTSRYDDTDLPGDMDIGYTHSTDGGSTWDSHKSILDFDASVPGSLGNGVSDPCILFDPVTDTIWVAGIWSFGDNSWTGSGPGTDPEDTVQYVLTKSSDGGDTWSAPINITADVKENPDWHFLSNAPGHGLVMRDGTLVFPSQRRDGDVANDGNNQMTACSVYSSDHGATWHFGSGLPEIGMENNENTVCELDSGELLFTCRPAIPGLRGWAKYTPGGAEPMHDGSWGPYSQQLPDPKCQASVFQWKSTFGGHPKEWILFANPADSEFRENMTLRISADGGATWPVSRVVDAGKTDYSSLCTLPDGSIGLLHEKGEGVLSITFVRVEEAWLLNSDVDTDDDGLPDGWEVIWGTDPGANDAEADPDGDGLDNISEYIAGLDPKAPRVLELVDQAVTPFGMEMKWNSAVGRVYDILWSPDLNAEPFTLLQDNLAYPINSYIDSVHGTNAAGFYRVEVRKP